VDYSLPDGYESRLQPDYFDDQSYDGVWQPDVYTEAAELARRLQARRVIDVGCGTAEKLAALNPEFELVGIDFGPNIEVCRERYEFGTWLEADLDRADSLPWSHVADSVLVCADVLEHLVHPEKLLRSLSSAVDSGARALVLSTPDRERINEPGHLGPPPNPAHVREWTRSELERFMGTFGLAGHFAYTRTNDVIPAVRTTIALVPGRAPRDRDVVGAWVEQRRFWEPILEGLEASFSTYEAWAQELQQYIEWLKEQLRAAGRPVEPNDRGLDGGDGDSGVRTQLRDALRRVRARAR
jgi:SAM-dependent methyltransferase